MCLGRAALMLVILGACGELQVAYLQDGGASELQIMNDELSKSWMLEANWTLTVIEQSDPAVDVGRYDMVFISESVLSALVDVGWYNHTGVPVWTTENQLFDDFFGLDPTVAESGMSSMQLTCDDPARSGGYCGFYPLSTDNKVGNWKSAVDVPNAVYFAQNHDLFYLYLPNAFGVNLRGILPWKVWPTGDGVGDMVLCNLVGCCETLGCAKPTPLGSLCTVSENDVCPPGNTIAHPTIECVGSASSSPPSFNRSFQCLAPCLVPYVAGGTWSDCEVGREMPSGSSCSLTAEPSYACAHAGEDNICTDGSFALTHECQACGDLCTDCNLTACTSCIVAAAVTPGGACACIEGYRKLPSGRVPVCLADVTLAHPPALVLAESALITVTLSAPPVDGFVLNVQLVFEPAVCSASPVANVIASTAINVTCTSEAAVMMTVAATGTAAGFFVIPDPASFNVEKRPSSEVIPPSGVVISNAVIFVSFDTAMDKTACQDATTYVDDVGASVPVTFQWTTDGRTFSAQPRGQQGDVEYTFMVGDTCTSLSGTAVAEEVIEVYTTFALAYVVLPAPGDVVDVDTDMLIVFGYKMATIPTAEAFKLLDASGEVVPGTWKWSGDIVFTFTPTHVLADSSSFTCLLTTDALTAAGERNLEDFTWSFDTRVPRLTLAAVTPDTTYRGAGVQLTGGFDSSGYLSCLFEYTARNTTNATMFNTTVVATIVNPATLLCNTSVLPWTDGVGWSMHVSATAGGVASSSIPVTVHDCPEGMFASSEEETCVPCPINTYWTFAQGDQKQCQPCPPERFAFEEGAVECEPCAIGQICVAEEQPGAALPTTVESASSPALIIGLVCVMACLLVLCAAGLVGAWMMSRKSVMKKYYIDDDATVRVGNEKAVSREIQAMLTHTRTTRIGGGQFTDIFKAKGDKHWVAIKVVKKESSGLMAAKAEFNKEVSILGRLAMTSHPAVIQMHFFSHANPMALVVELCEGGTLKSLLGARPLPVTTRLKIISQCAAGLAYVHGTNVVHLDIKTDNVLIDGDKNAKLADFGISAVVDAQGAPIQTGSIGGQHMSTSGPDVASADDNTAAPAHLSAVSVATTEGSTGAPAPPDSFLASGQSSELAFSPQYVDPRRLANVVSDWRGCDIFSFGTLMLATWSQQEPFADVNPQVLITNLASDPTLRPAKRTDCEWHTCIERLIERCWSEDDAFNAEDLFQELDRCGWMHFDLNVDTTYHPAGYDCNYDL